MSLARQFGMEAPVGEVSSPITPFTSLAVSLKSRAQAQVAQNAQNNVIDMSVSRNNIRKLDTELKQNADGSLIFTVYIDTERALKSCEKVLVAKGFHFARLSDWKLLIVPRDNSITAQIGFELTVEADIESACTTRIRFSAPQSYVSLSTKDAFTWAMRLKELHHAIVSTCS
jgi:hypothetical protein